MGLLLLIIVGVVLRFILLFLEALLAIEDEPPTKPGYTRLRLEELDVPRY